MNVNIFRLLFNYDLLRDLFFRLCGSGLASDVHISLSCEYFEWNSTLTYCLFFKILQTEYIIILTDTAGFLDTPSATSTVGVIHTTHVSYYLLK